MRKPNKSQYKIIPSPDAKSVSIFTLAGVGSIGMNWTLYGHNGRWILVDAGIGFAPRDIVGVEALFPNPSLLRSIEGCIDALVITHAHEDHIGAIHRLWPSFKFPIYATPFAAELIMDRLHQRGTLDKVQIKTFKPGDRFQVGQFDIDTIPMVHSTPECVALAIATPAGKVLHTGDWKFDGLTCPVRELTKAKLEALANENILAIVGDSTNADTHAPMQSEEDVLQGLTKAFNDAPEMVVASCFASNIDRIKSILIAAAAAGRSVYASGRSIARNIQIASRLGMLDDVPMPMEDKVKFAELPRSRRVILCTGTQGEERASLTRLANGLATHLPNVEAGDWIIRSARTIPGNETDVEATLAAYRALEAVIVDSEYMGHPLHVSGHAYADEIEMLYKYVKPRFSIPVHGELEHQLAHKEIAKKTGIVDFCIPEAGSIFTVNNEGIRLLRSLNIHLVAEFTGKLGSFPRWDEDYCRALQAYESLSAMSVDPVPPRTFLGSFAA